TIFHTSPIRPPHPPPSPLFPYTTLFRSGAIAVAPAPAHSSGLILPTAAFAQCAWRPENRTCALSVPDRAQVRFSGRQAHCAKAAVGRINPELCAGAGATAMAPERKSVV